MKGVNECIKVEQGVEVFNMNCVYVLDRGKGDLGHQDIVTVQTKIVKRKIKHEKKNFE